MLTTEAPVLDALRAHGVSSKTLFHAMSTAEQSGRVLRDVLVDEGLVTELELAEALALAFGLKCVDLMSYAVDAAAMAKIPVALARRHRVLGISLDDDEIVVAVADPGDVLALDDVRAATGLRVQPVVVPRDELMKAMERLQRAENDLDDVAASLGLDTAANSAQRTRFGRRGSADRALRQLAHRASDRQPGIGSAHRAGRARRPGAVPHRWRAARDGRRPALGPVRTHQSTQDHGSRRHHRAPGATERPHHRRSQVTRGRPATRDAAPPCGARRSSCAYSTPAASISTSPASASARPTTSGFAASFGRPHGMLLVTGPTGSGKSTTLYSTLAEISKPEVNIITVEDPVEYRLPGVNQVQVNHKAGLTFAAVLPAILRSDPDVVLIGEIRDRVTAQLAIEASLTGHLVLSTLHTNDAPSAVTRLIEMGIEPFLVGSSLDCVMAQRLARRLCIHCRRAYTPTDAELASAPRWPHDRIPVPTQLWQAAGCRSCSGTGYRGRVALHEVMPVGEEIERLAVERASSHELQRVAVAEGMDVLRTDGLRKAVAGDTTLTEVLRVAI